MVIWVVCLAGTVGLFVAIPKTFLAPGDSSFIWGVMISREGSSPEQMHALQDQADEVIRQNPAVDATFTMTGNSQFLASNQGLLLCFLKGPEERAPIQAVAGQLMGKLGTIPGVFPFCALSLSWRSAQAQQTAIRGSMPSPSPA